MKIHIPNSAFLGNIDTFLKGIDPSEPERLEVSFNKKWSSVHPMVLAMVASVGHAMMEQGNPIQCERIEAKSGPYFVRMGLMQYLTKDSQQALVEREPAGRFIPLTNIRHSDHLDQFLTNLVPLLHTDPNHADAIKYSVDELVRNVLEHAKSPYGAMVCAQFFKKSNRVSIGVADAGIGIKTSMQQAHLVDTDKEAIKLALTPGVTGTTTAPGGTARNAGAGLFFVKSIAKVNRDFFTVYSGNALYKLLKTKNDRITLNADPLKDRNSFSDGFPVWKGTAVGIDISTNQSQNFSELLTMIRKVYALDVKDSRKERYKKPRFV